MSSFEELYNSQQIKIPPNLPGILKSFTKAAIRTQPYDLLCWSAAYFKAISRGEKPPVKERLEFPTSQSLFGLTPGYVRLLTHQLRKSGKVGHSVLKEKWLAVSLSNETLEDLLKLGRFQGEINVLKFIALAAATLEPSLKRTMIFLCELLTEEPEGGSAMVPAETFIGLYQYLAEMDCGPVDPGWTRTPEQPSGSAAPTPSTPASDAEETRTHAKALQSWDSLLKKIKEQDSKDSISTVEGSETGLMVWPQISDTEISETVLVGNIPSDEGLTSAYGIQVWDEGEHDVQKVHTIEGPEEVLSLSEEVLGKEEEIEEEIEEEEEKEVAIEESEINEESEGPELEDDEEGIVEGLEKSEEELTIKSVEDEEGGKRVEKEKRIQESKETAKLGQERPQRADLKESQIVTVLEARDTIPISPETSDVETDEGTVEIKDLTECSDVSVGMPLSKKVSLHDVRILTREKREEEKEEEVYELVEEEAYTQFWMAVPGVGPVVPPEIVSRAVKYFEDRSQEQEGMIMPRNIRHYLCPPLEEVHDFV